MAGVGTSFVLVVNAMMLGGLAGYFTNHGLANEFWCTVAAHGVLEFLAIFTAAGAGLRMGLSLAIPGRLTRKASLKAGAREAVLVLSLNPFLPMAVSAISAVAARLWWIAGELIWTLFSFIWNGFEGVGKGNQQKHRPTA